MSVTETGQSEIPDKDAGCNAVTDTRVITDYRQSEIPSGVPNAPGFGAEGWKKDRVCNAVTDTRTISQQDYGDMYCQACGYSQIPDGCGPAQEEEVPTTLQLT